MEHYDYKEAVLADIREYLNDQYEQDELRERLSEDREEFESELNDKLWIEDSVTGNASGSYTFSTWKAEEYLCHNSDLLMEAMNEFGCEPNDYKGAEWGDVTIRCYLLGQCLGEVLDELENELLTNEEE
ncbi:MAG: hypothetical protein IJ640_00070 [Prevotella sp.]|nr:hypothetical protein [Prevotella sp.]